MVGSLDTFTEVLVAMARYDAVRGGDGHVRVTSIQAKEHQFGIALRIRISHKKPDGEKRNVGAEYMMSPSLEYFTKKALWALEEGHEMLDTWAFDGKNILLSVD